MDRGQLRDPGHEGIFRNSVLVAAGQGSAGLLFLIYVLAARVLGDAAFGEFTLGMTVALLLITLPAWGTNRYSSIVTARSPERTDEVLASANGLMLVASIAYLPLVWFAAALVARGVEAVPVVAIGRGIDLLVREYGNRLRLLMRVHGRFGLDTITVFIERGLMVAGALSALAIRPDPVVLAAGFAAGRSMGSLITSAVYRARVGPIRVRFDRLDLRRMIGQGTPLALRRGIADLTFRVDTVFLGVLRTSNEVGWYGAVYSLMDGALMFPNAVTGSLGPTLSANFGEGREAVVGRLYRRGIKYLLVGGAFVATACAVLADPIVHLLYGAEYAPAGSALRILAPAVVFVFLRRQATELLDNVDRRSETVWVFFAGFAANVVLNALLVPTYGYLGAAASTALTEGCVALTMMWMIHRSGYGATPANELVGIAAATLFTAATMLLLADTLLVALLVGGIIHVGLLGVFRVWDEKDLRAAGVLVDRALSRRRRSEEPQNED